MQNLSPLEAMRARWREAVKASPAAAWARQSQSQWDDAGSRSRSLHAEEVRGLQERGNFCENWDRVRMLGEGGLESVSQCRFEGRVLLHLERQPARIWRSRIRDAYIGSAEIEAVGLLDRVWVEDAAQLRQVDSVTGGASPFCLGLAIHPGNETGSRSVWLVDGLGLDDCMRMASLIPADQAALAKQIQDDVRNLQSAWSWIGAGARIESTRVMADVFVGAGSVIRGANLVQRCVLVADQDVPVRLGVGAVAEDVILEPGSCVNTSGMALRSLLLEGATVEKSGQISDTVLGPNTHVAKGEITASLVGPFVGFHHQALLIAALWPEGRGNVGYGAKVGSNHTGRKPDQEIRPGEGMFFGLGCSIQFPADFSGAPYSLFATGITTQPQRLAFPLSLIRPAGGVLPAEAAGLNEIVPGWMWSDNAYALIRNAYKYLDRNRARRNSPNMLAPPGSPLAGTFLEAAPFAPHIGEQVRQALIRLRQVAANETMDFYLESNLPGLGKNVLHKKRLSKAIAGYENYLCFVLFRIILWDSAPQSEWADAKNTLTALGLSGRETQTLDSTTLFEGLRVSVAEALSKDAKRGAAIFDDYAAFHEEPAYEPVYLRLLQDLHRLAKPLEERLQGLQRFPE